MLRLSKFGCRLVYANVSFKMHGWGSNSKVVNRNLSKLGVDSGIISLGKSPDEKAFGLQWDKNLDCLHSLFA